MENVTTKVSGAKLMTILNCSKPYLYDLINKRVITPYYFESEKGNFTKPFFDTQEVFAALKPMPGGGTKRMHNREGS